jgi:hypothetical protein
MNLTDCPYCYQPGLVTTYSVQAGHGFVVQGKCVECGYTCDSEYAPAEPEQADDLPGEYWRPLDPHSAD